MYKTSAEAEETRRESVSVTMCDKKEVVEIYGRNTADALIVGETVVNLSPKTFIGLVAPILKAIGYNLTPTPEAV